MTILIVSVLLMVSFLLTLTVKEFAIKLGAFDKPNDRSSHIVPTPTIGGIAIVISFLVGIILLSYSYKVPDKLLLSFLLGGGLLAIIGLFDDIKTISVKYRLSIHILVSILTVYWLDTHLFSDWFTYNIGGFVYLSVVISLIILLFSINIMNFMDGIDGIVGTEVVFVASVITAILIGQNNIVEARYFAILVTISLGFLALNFPPAQIFMGDVGSIFLGFILGVLLIHTVNSNIVEVWTWLILLAMFWVDVVYVLFVRVFNNKKTVIQAHKTHFYQKITAKIYKTKTRTYAHRVTVMLTSAINIFWLLPLAIIAQYYPEYGFYSLIVSILPIIFLMWKFKAGKV